MGTIQPDGPGPVGFRQQIPAALLDTVSNPVRVAAAHCGLEAYSKSAALS